MKGGSALAGVALAVLAGCSTAPPVARVDSFSVGRNGAGEACIASRRWNDPAAPDAFARAYAITCSSAAANRPLGTLRVVADTPAALTAADAQFDCGAEAAVTLAGRPARARRCLDRATGLDSIRIDQRRGRELLVGAAAPAVLAQLEEAMAIVAGARAPSADITRTPAATIDPGTLPGQGGAGGAVAVQGDAATRPAPFSAAAALAQGIDLNHKGLDDEASRLLNDALSRLPADTPVGLRAELELEAGIADSNIRFPDAAQAHFAAADAVFAASPAARTAFLQRKRDTYVALDALNRRAWREGLTALDRVASAQPIAAAPLTDPNTLRLLNQPSANGAAALAVPDAGQLAQLVLDAQAHYARSVALLSLGDQAGASAAIESASATYRPLASERLDQAQLLWLGARIARQRGRIEAKRGDYGAALDSFDRGVDMLRRGAVANGGTGNEPAIAEAELERAAVFARTNPSARDVRDTFARAVDALIASGSTALGQSQGMEDYLDLLVREAASAPQADTYDRFFRATQASGEPAAARQLSRLRAVVTADPALGQAVRERADLEREITRLRYAIANRGEDKPAGVAAGDLDAARARAEARLIAVDAGLAKDPRYRQVDEAPATLAELRAALRPGEAYVKLTELDRRLYAMVVTADRTFAYHVAESAGAKQVVDQLGEQLRASIDGDLSIGKLVPFDEARAYTLFRLVAGPAAGVLAGARAIVIDPAGPMRRIPLGVLVTRFDPQAVRVDPFDFSRTAFVTGHASVATALSPRSFLVARALPASRAPRAFIGLGEHQPPPAAAEGSTRAVEVGVACAVDFGKLATLSRTLKPISRRELAIASGALGAPGAATITGAGFTDIGVEDRGDLDQYEVLHFATHGLEEGMWGCSKSPPALVTSFAGAGSDGLLDFAEVARLKLDANLVYLSACDTGAGVRNEALARQSGQEEAGATLDGLVRAFLTANARAVIATYWQVSAERESDAFIEAFYADARARPIGEALQAAQRRLIAQPAYSHPFYWAPYFLVGDGGKTALSPAGARVAAR